jgi:hypothetical protein
MSRKKNVIKVKKFANGSIRSDDNGKGAPALMPVLSLLRLSKWYEKGAETYGPRNYERGQSHLRIYNALWRHLLKATGGAKDEDHLAAIAWNCLTLMQQEELMERGLLSREFDDLRKMLDSKGKQCIPLNVFLDDEFGASFGKVDKKASLYQKKQKKPRKKA